MNSFCNSIKKYFGVFETKCLGVFICICGLRQLYFFKTEATTFCCLREIFCGIWYKYICNCNLIWIYFEIGDKFLLNLLFTFCGWVGFVGRVGGSGGLGALSVLRVWVICVGLATWAPEGREGRSQGPKGPQLEVGARRAPRLLVST